MHVPDGVLSLPVAAVGAVGTLAALGVSLPRLDAEALPRVAVMSAVFFVASLINVPVGPSTVHLLLSGLMGLALGWAAVPATLVALILQAVFFGFGGLTSLGVNTLNIALPGILAAALVRPLLHRTTDPTRIGLVAAGAAMIAVFGSAGLLLLSLVLSDAAYAASVPLIALSYTPLLIAEMAIAGFAAAFLARVKPEVLLPPRPAHG